MRTINSERGYSMMEVLISTALGTIVLAGAFDVYVSSTKSLQGQTNSVQMQSDTKAAMDYMIRELRMAQTAYSAPAITTTLVPSDTISFTRTEDAGFSS
ncbi:MAG: prepilin-type N-terminal cleavage/methylation domain-containing protein, partial [Nitrospirae bacterium]